MLKFKTDDPSRLDGLLFHWQPVHQDILARLGNFSNAVDGPSLQPHLVLQKVTRAAEPGLLLATTPKQNTIVCRMGGNGIASEDVRPFTEILFYSNWLRGRLTSRPHSTVKKIGQTICVLALMTAPRKKPAEVCSSGGIY